MPTCFQFYFYLFFINFCQALRNLDEDENDGDENEDEPEEGEVDAAADVEDDEVEKDDLEPEPVKQTKSRNHKKFEISFLSKTSFSFKMIQFKYLL